MQGLNDSGEGKKEEKVRRRHLCVPLAKVSGLIDQLPKDRRQKKRGGGKRRGLFSALSNVEQPAGIKEAKREEDVKTSFRQRWGGEGKRGFSSNREGREKKNRLSIPP